MHVFKYVKDVDLLYIVLARDFYIENRNKSSTSSTGQITPPNNGEVGGVKSIKSRNREVRQYMAHTKYYIRPKRPIYTVCKTSTSPPKKRRFEK